MIGSAEYTFRLPASGDFYWLANEFRRMTSLRNGDVLLKRGGDGWLPRLIARAGRGPWTHAAMLARDVNSPVCLEMTEREGGRQRPLRERVAEAPGQWDVFRPIGPYYDGSAAVECMRGLLGEPYGWLNLLWVALAHVPWFWRLTPGDLIDDQRGSRRWKICSRAVSHALRMGGVDPVPNLADDYTEPCDLARSAALRYLATLTVNA